MPSIKSVSSSVRQYAMVAAGGLGLTGGRALSGPLQAQIGISDPCNHKCVFCWDHPPEDRANESTANRFGGLRPAVMALEQFKGIVDDLHDLGTRRVDIVGRGEPLSNRHVVEMVTYVKRRGMQSQMSTNGSRLTETVAKGLVDAGLDRMNISLNAGTPETYPHIHVTETPANYLKVKKNLRFLSDCKIAAGSAAPYLSLSFAVSAKNYFEIADMIEVAHEVGAEEAQFAHTIVHDGTKDLALSEAQHRELVAAVPAVRARAAALGVQNNLEAFGANVPLYLPSEMVGPSVVPCYVGWYFTVILGNGSVLPCPHGAGPAGQVTETRRFSEVWASPEYAEFRTAAKSLPEQNDLLMSCECDNCQLRPRNLAIHNFLHPLGRIPAGDEVQKFTPGDFLRKMQGRYGTLPTRK